MQPDDMILCNNNGQRTRQNNTVTSNGLTETIVKAKNKIEQRGPRVVAIMTDKTNHGSTT